MNQQHGASPASNEAIVPVYRAAIRVLTWGFRTGAGILLLGLVVSLIKREALNTQVDPFADILPTLFDGKPAAIIDLAILTFMATPLLTVVVVAIGFMRAGDRRYGMLSFIVLGVLCISVTLSLLR